MIESNVKTISKNRTISIMLDSKSGWREINKNGKNKAKNLPNNNKSVCIIKKSSYRTRKTLTGIFFYNIGWDIIL
jgi:hypothetical protein